MQASRSQIAPDGGTFVVTEQSGPQARSHVIELR
jgi:hypothetical protein